MKSWLKAVRGSWPRAGGDQEIVQSYAYRSACPSTVWGDLIADATRDLFFGGYTSYFLWTHVPALPELLRQKAANGCRVRFLLGDPNSSVTRQREEIEDVAMTVSTRIRTTMEQLARMGEVEGLEARFSAPADATNHVSLSVFRFDDEVLVTPHLARLVGHDSPLLHLRRRGDRGMFSRFVEHAEELWSRGVPIAEPSLKPGQPGLPPQP
ncbi:XRE family transcriptional regulator [Streptomyces sp. NPDC026206]|uniref:XRE family transcriptional regulator n=1 Tax=Streptomyces sp. NPDC026206 TaxID=3157089 RepID=UPI0033D0DEF9